MEALPPIRFAPDGRPELPPELPSDLVELAGIPYLERIYVARERRFSVRFHHLLADDERDLHDHPWDFASLILVGAYRETTPEGVHEYEAPTLIRHRAEDLHRLELLSPDAWTLVTTGPIRRHWGFLTPEGWLPWETYGEQRTEISPAR